MREDRGDLEAARALDVLEMGRKQADSEGQKLKEDVVSSRSVRLFFNFRMQRHLGGPDCEDNDKLFLKLSGTSSYQEQQSGR